MRFFADRVRRNVARASARGKTDLLVGGAIRRCGGKARGVDGGVFHVGSGAGADVRTAGSVGYRHGRGDRIGILGRGWGSRTRDTSRTDGVNRGSDGKDARAKHAEEADEGAELVRHAFEGVVRVRRDFAVWSANHFGVVQVGFRLRWRLDGFAGDDVLAY